MTLLTRLTAATGPDRGIDAEIAKAIGWKRVDRPMTDWVAPDRQEYYGLYPMPRYTASLDAALTLIPGDYGISSLYESYDRSTWGAKITDRSNPPISHEGGAPTPVLAICIACIRARATAGQQGE